MPSTYTENADKWKSLADIDYFTHFVKAWIPFNAWYKTYYPTLRTDREAINEIKSNANAARNRFLSLLNGANDESEQFRSNLAHLHYCLNNTVVENNEQRIYFESFVIEMDRTCITQNDAYNGINYYVQLTLTGAGITRTVATVVNSTRRNLLNYNHTEYDLQHLRADREFGRLSRIQRQFLEQKFNDANPFKPINLLSADPNNCIRVGQYNLINDPTTIFKGVLEMLYNLRNVLFHGQIIPNRDTNTVYEPAYKVLKMIVEGL
jgi:hypothetical protein